MSSHSKLIASISAMLFISHPVQTEAVTYIFQRLASLVTTFYLLSLVCYIKYRIQESGVSSQNKKQSILNSGFWILNSLFCAVLAMKTKENAFTLPFIITLYEFSFFRGPIKPRLLRLVPILLTLFIIPLSLAGNGTPGEIISQMDIMPRGYQEISRPEYLLTQFRVIVTYIRLLFLPVNQNIDYDYPISGSFLEPRVFLSFIFLSFVLGFSVYLFRKSRFQNPDLRVVSFGIFWFFITLLVESSVIPIPMIICEYRIYLPSVGAFLSITTGVLLIIGRLVNSKIKTAALLSVIAVPFIFSYAAYSRNSLWADQTALWEDVVVKSPANARGHNNLGYILYNKGMIDRAIEHYRTALKLNPTANGYNNLGNAYRVKGLIDKAKEQYLIALSIEPGNAKAYNNLGVVYEDKGMTDTAIEYYRTASELMPGNADIHYNLGIAYYSAGRKEKAVEQLQQVLELNPDHPKARYDLRAIYRTAVP